MSVDCQGHMWVPAVISSNAAGGFMVDGRRAHQHPRVNATHTSRPISMTPQPISSAATSSPMPDLLTRRVSRVTFTIHYPFDSRSESGDVVDIDRAACRR